MRYFQSTSPQVSVYAPGGQVVKWTTVDGVIGWFATDREPTIKALVRCIERKVGGGISEISEKEYEDLVGKAKGRPLFRPDREHISAAGIVQPQVAPLADPLAAGAVADKPAPAVADVEEPDSVSAAPTEPEVRKRGRPRKV